MHNIIRWEVLFIHMAKVHTRALQEATELTDLFQRVDAVFASGNYQRIASLLSTMRRSLALVGSVPEFQGSKEKLEASLQSQITFLVTSPPLCNNNCLLVLCFEGCEHFSGYFKQF